MNKFEVLRLPVNDNTPLGSSVVSPCNRMKLFLAGRVPQHQSDIQPRQLQTLNALPPIKAQKGWTLWSIKRYKYLYSSFRIRRKTQNRHYCFCWASEILMNVKFVCIFSVLVRANFELFANSYFFQILKVTRLPKRVNFSLNQNILLCFHVTVFSCY